MVRWLQRAGADFIVQGNPEIFGLLFNFLSLFDDIVACPLHGMFFSKNRIGAGADSKIVKEFRIGADRIKNFFPDNQGYPKSGPTL